MAARAVSAPLAQLPNALTIFRLLLIPVFVVLMIDAGDAPSWPAGIVFGVAGVTDQVDGFLARRWHVESRFGKIADPLADRLMIDAAVILLVVYGRLPWVGLVVIIARDVLLIVGYRVLSPRGYELDVSFLGKAATWVLYAGDRLPHRHRRLDEVAARPLLDRARDGRRRGGVLREGRVEGAALVKAVVMAGGEGTRLRPLTSNQPKPMVPIVGKPCMEHIIELLKRHGMTDVIVTVAFLPQAIRSYFGNGEALGVDIGYSVEESPLGTAGSVRLAAGRLDDTFLVISGDALCDVDLTQLVEFHKEKKASVTIGLKAVENPLEFGIVVTDDDGRVERFLEKPSWGQVFSDTINTGIYVLEPEVLKHVPTDRPYDFSKELFPLLLEMGRPIYGCVLDGYWQDIGNLDQYRQANFDALDERVQLDIGGIRIRGNVWLGEGVDLAELEAVEGPAYIGSYCRISPQATIAPYSVLSTSVTVREGARTSHSIVDASTYIGRSAVVEGAIIGRSCDLRAHVRVHDGVAIGDEVSIGAESVIMPGVRIYPHKEVESGSQIFESLIWESRGTTRVFGKSGVAGMVNVDLTPDVALRLAAAFGTALKREARVVASREGSAGVPDDQAGDALRTVVDRRRRRRSPGDPGGGRAPVPEGGGLPRRLPRRREPRRPGGDPDPVLRAPRDRADRRAPGRGREALLPRRAAARLRHRGGDARRIRPASARATRAACSQPSTPTTIRERGFRIVVDYGFSAASSVLPLVAGPLGVEAVAAHAFPGEGGAEIEGLEASIEEAKRLVPAVGADLGAVFDRAGERLYLVDEHAREIPVEQALLLYVSLIRAAGRTGRLAFPVNATSQVDRLVEGSGLEIVRTARRSRR